MKEICACVQYRHKREGQDQRTSQKKEMLEVWKDKCISSKLTREGPFRYGDPMTFHIEGHIVMK